MLGGRIDKLERNIEMIRGYEEHGGKANDFRVFLAEFRDNVGKFTKDLILEFDNLPVKHKADLIEIYKTGIEKMSDTFNLLNGLIGIFDVSESENPKVVMAFSTLIIGDVNSWQLILPLIKNI